MGLDLEMRQQNLRNKLQGKHGPTDKGELDLEESWRKLSKHLDTWYANLVNFMPPDVLQERMPIEVAPEKSCLHGQTSFGWNPRLDPAWNPVRILVGQSLF
ncbi:hypothetical protein M422DRAFT_28469 [Sphaerobolus stellatus SS14]|nr:hypothetical protein M422DRAFT_28469 [Sphaerobolus stellatus SS14]